MVLPLIPVVIVAGTLLSGGGGAAIGIRGGTEIKRAKSEMKDAAARYEIRHTRHLSRVEATNIAFHRFGESQERAQHDVIFRMKDFLERHAKQVRAKEHLILDGVDESNRPVVGLAKLDADVAGWVQGVVGGAIAGVATPVAIRAGVMALASAGTGTAIAGLSGAAAVSATLAWLGGGSLAAGGGGIALGAAMLNVAVLGPSLLFAGITVKNRGTKARTEAETFRTEVDVAIAQLDVRDSLLEAVKARAREVDVTLNRLMRTAVGALDLLESEPFDVELHAKRLQEGLILVKAVRDVATALIADDDGNLNEQTNDLLFRYRSEVTQPDEVKETLNV